MAEKDMDSKTKTIVKKTKELREKCNIYKKQIIENNSSVNYVYNPLDYAWKPHEFYLEKYGRLGAKTIIMGMNPGHGMGNTGIPFGCPEKVRTYLNITNLKVKQPMKIHPKREIAGLECKKPEISGKRIWGLIEEIYGSPTNAFKEIFVINHFPLWMFNKSGQNITPDKLRKSTTKEIFTVCNKYLTDIAHILNSETIIGVGKYAHKMANIAISDNGIENITVKEIPHPSPANPLANKDKGKIWKNLSKEVIQN